MMSARIRRLSVAVVLAGLALAVALSGTGRAAPEPGRPTPERAANPFDDVPGMGRSPEAVARDEAISYWEAWKRDAAVQACMRRAGFEWEPEVAYPSEAVLMVAEYLGVPPADDGVGGGTAVSRNAGRARVMDDATRDGYYRTLLGESADSIAFMEGNDGALPPGESAEDFATGGCRGAAEAAVGSLWNLRRQVGPELSARVRAALGASDLATQRNRFRECAAQHGLARGQSPADVDRALARGDETVALAVEQGCSEIWRQVDDAALGRAAGAFRTVHASALDRQRRTYAHALTDMRRNPDFVQFLAAAAARP
jgi:hypothetical protein